MKETYGFKDVRDFDPVCGKCGCEKHLDCIDNGCECDCHDEFCSWCLRLNIFLDDTLSLDEIEIDEDEDEV